MRGLCAFLHLLSAAVLCRVWSLVHLGNGLWLGVSGADGVRGWDWGCGFFFRQRARAFVGRVFLARLHDCSGAGFSSPWGDSWGCCGVRGRAALRPRLGVGRSCVLCWVGERFRIVGFGGALWVLQFIFLCVFWFVAHGAGVLVLCRFV